MTNLTIIREERWEVTGFNYGHIDRSPQQCGHTHFTPVECINTVQKCPDCGEFLKAYSFEYTSRHPQAMESAVAQALREHQSGRCPETSHHDHVVICDLCGEEIGRWDEDYCYNNPTGLDVAVEQAREDHELHYCQVVWQKNWDTWRKDSGALEDETPRALLNRLREDDMWEELYNTPTPPDRADEQWQEEIEELVAK